MGEVVVDDEVVIIGSGISGLATALALHKKGIKSIVMERSETLRTTTGAAIGIWPNGWRALDQLGVADNLRRITIPIHKEKTISLDDGKLQEMPLDGEARCLRRKDLIDTLYDALPPGTVRFGCQLESIRMGPNTTKPILRFIDGTTIIAKVVIGCDGGKSIIADYLNLKPTKMLLLCIGRGLSNYPNGHSFGHGFLHIGKENNFVGRVPIDNNLVFWFCTLPYIPRDETTWKEPEEIRRTILDLLHEFPQEIQEMIKSADAKSLSSTHIRYRATWDLLTGTFSKGTVTVVGDAMHVMGPFLGQGGSSSLEDAIVLARNLAKTDLIRVETRRKARVKGVEEAFNQYVKERKMRVVRLSLQAHLIGLLIRDSSRLKKLMCIVLLFILFRNQRGHVDYDCGGL